MSGHHADAGGGQIVGRDEFYWSFPAGVRLTFADGRTELRLFGTRLEAEAFVAIIPLLQVWGHEEAAGVTAAILVTMLGL